MCDGTKQQALEVFQKLQTEFPHLAMNIDSADSDVEVSYTIPQQIGLAFDVQLNLQNDDELYLTVGAFWCSWFPISKPDVLKRYHDAVAGILAGRNRIVEYVRWGRIVGADLQVPHACGWKTIASSRGALLPVSLFSQRRFLVNSGAL